MVELADTIFSDGPSSNPDQPMKPRIREWGTWIESVITAFVSGAGTIFVSKVSMDANLNYPTFTMAWVLGDATVANNGVYRKIGDPGFGFWVRTGDLPYSFIIASDAGAGTPNAIVATTSIPVSPSALVWMEIAATNTGSPVTVNFNGTSPATIKTNSGNDIAAGGLAAGMIVMGILSGGTFRLISDQASEAILAGAEAAKAAAEAARDDVISIAASIVSEQPSRSYATASYHPVVAPDFVRTAGYYAAGDLGGALYKKVASEPSHSGKFAITLAGIGSVVWYALTMDAVTPEMFGAKGDSDGTIGGGTNDLAAFQAAVDFSDRVFLTRSNCSYRLHGELLTNRFTSIIGFSAANSDDAQSTSAPKLIFSGTGVACIRTKDAVNVSSHSRVTGFVLRSLGTYDWMMKFKGCVDMLFEDFRLQTTVSATGGFYSVKNFPGDNSWTNCMRRVGIRLLDAGTQRSCNIDWSDSDVANCQFTGGKGVVDNGYGSRFQFCQIERSNSVGLTINKPLASKMTRVIGCQLDANTTYGIMLDTSGDVSTNYVFNVAVVGCTFRTVDANGAGAGTADIALVNASGNTYNPGTFVDNTHEIAAVPPVLNSGNWAGGKFVGPHTQVSSTAYFSLAERHLWVTTGGIKVPEGAVVANAARTYYGQAGCSAFFGGTNTGAAGVVAGNDGNGAFIGASQTSGAVSQNLALYIGGTEMLRFSADRAFVIPFVDNAVNLGNASKRFNTVYAGTGTINTSDERLKTEIGPIPDEVLDAWEAVEWVQYRFVDGARLHTGVIAQRVKAEFEARGLDATEYGLLCHDEWDDEYEDRLVAVFDDDGQPLMQSVPLVDYIKRDDGTIEELIGTREEPVVETQRVLVVPAGDRWAIRYEEALVMEAALMRRELKRLRK
ncbi:tail fiber domain-containing protein [Ensifer sp. ENS02]|uniref:tail fiber domain-containing protein n=1 Tax=Ensifer sp. ENS02 TaxID=2769290 RepID=UPI00177A9240|nr:tail fiber domain-containing protein [Ensifer sp. ENS02]MBD9519274.1 tail fiber domain-containing protein [Ensifer sp. ENS02]